MRIVRRETALWNDIGDGRAPRPGHRSRLAVGALNNPKMRDVRTGSELQRQPSSDFPSISCLYDLIADRLVNSYVVKRAVAIDQSQSVFPRDLVVISCISDVVIAFDISNLAESQEVIHPANTHPPFLRQLLIHLRPKG